MRTAEHDGLQGSGNRCDSKYNKGFGGHGRDALKRIMSPIRLEIPELIDSIPEKRAEVFCEEAAVFARRHSGDLCYLDPPYNQHQYGSDYICSIQSPVGTNRL